MTDPEIVRLAAGRVMGYQPLPLNEWNRGSWFLAPGESSIFFNPLASLHCALELLDAMRKMGFAFSIFETPHSIFLNGPLVMLSKGVKPVERNAEGKPGVFSYLVPGGHSIEGRCRAITLCCLRAVGVEVGE